MEYKFGTAPVALRIGRVHDVTGASARVFAIIQAAQAGSDIVWINGVRQTEQLYPQGLANFFNPSRLIAVNARNYKEALWCMEEALREVSATVIATIPKPMELMASRRLQLAAEAGDSTGLCLTPDMSVNNAAETRWRCTPLTTTQDSTLHKWELIKNKRGILGIWNVNWDATSHNLTVVSASGGRACAAERWDKGSNPPLRSCRDAQERLTALLDQRGR